MSEKRIGVEYSQKEIQKALLARFKDPSDEKLAETIVGYLSVLDQGLPGVMKALMGVHPSCKYKVGDMVWVKYSVLPSWKMDKIETKTLPHYKEDKTYDRDGLLLCQIEEVNVYNVSPYSIRYSVYETGVIKETTYLASDVSIAYKEESFFNILDSFEQLKQSQQAEDDTPF